MFRVRVDRSLLDRRFDEIRRGFDGMDDVGNGRRRLRYVIGSDLPYAYRWIEEGERSDWRYGTLHIYYHRPPEGGAHFLEAGANAINSYITQYEYVIGANMVGWSTSAAYTAAREMRQTLARDVYANAPYNPYTKSRWRRGYALYDDIQPFRVQ